MSNKQSENAASYDALAENSYVGELGEGDAQGPPVARKETNQSNRSGS